jgi:alkylation response protein AidB-like acyl-CoA dehydrogenase
MTTLQIDYDLLDVALELGPFIKQHSAEGERNRRVSPDVIQAMKDAGLVRMMTPRSLGGLELDPVTCARVFEEVARFDSAASWILQAANSGDFYTSTARASLTRARKRSTRTARTQSPLSRSILR